MTIKWYGRHDNSFRPDDERLDRPQTATERQKHYDWLGEIQESASFDNEVPHGRAVVRSNPAAYDRILATKARLRRKK